MTDVQQFFKYWIMFWFCIAILGICGDILWALACRGCDESLIGIMIEAGAFAMLGLGAVAYVVYCAVTGRELLP